MTRLKSIGTKDTEKVSESGRTGVGGAAVFIQEKTYINTGEYDTIHFREKKGDEGNSSSPFQHQKVVRTELAREARETQRRRPGTTEGS